MGVNTNWYSMALQRCYYELGQGLILSSRFHVEGLEIGLIIMMMREIQKWDLQPHIMGKSHRYNL